MPKPNEMHGCSRVHVRAHIPLARLAEESLKRCQVVRVRSVEPRSDADLFPISYDQIARHAHLNSLLISEDYPAIQNVNFFIAPFRSLRPTQVSQASSESMKYFFADRRSFQLATSNSVQVF